MLTSEQLKRLPDRLIELGYEVYGPTRQDPGVMLGRLGDGADLDLDHVLTVNTLKDILFPRCEILATYDRERATLEGIPLEERRIAVIGSRPCDAAALAVLDRILAGEVRDARFAARRERAVILTLGCGECDSSCFCESVGYGPHDETGSDVLLLPSAGGYVVRAITNPGTGLLNKLGLGSDDEAAPDTPPRLSRRVATAGLKARLDSNFESPVWHKVSEACVSCGVCTYLCPTCHCYDIIDEAGLSRGERLRTWDACTFGSFTRMAGHQPRAGKHARYRQRIMHKFKYCPETVGLVACVGDGRCIRHCPFGVDLREVIEILSTEE
jgi:hypothetical protein